MDDLHELVCGLRDKDNSFAFDCLKKLEYESGLSDAVYAYLDTFAEMLDSPNSYVRTRGLRLISCNVKWDEKDKFNALLGPYLEHILDEKPVTARQCIQSLPAIARNKPAVAGRICAALKNADTARYKASMRPLIEKDIAVALEKIESAQ